MFSLIFGIIVAVALFVILGFKKVEIDTWHEGLEWKLRKGQVIALSGLLICIFGFISQVPVNSVGIVYSPFGGTSEETLSEGFHIKSPFDKVYKITTEVQTTSISNLTTQTMDAQFLTSVLDIKYKVSANNAFVVFKQYRTLDKMAESLITPTTQRVLELITTKYNIIDILGDKRAEVYAELDKALNEEFAKYGVEFISISIVDMDAGAELEAAISAEAVAKKAVETAEQELKKAEIEAQKLSVQAKAEQDAARIEAETLKIQAQAEKDANELLNMSLSDKLLDKEWIEKWDGKLPTYYGGENTDLLIGIGGGN